MASHSKINSGADHSKHPTTCAGEPAFVIDGGARLDDVGAFGQRLIGTGDYRTAHRMFGVAFRAEDDCDRGTVGPGKRRLVSEVAGGRCVQQLTERSLQPGQQRLGLWVTETGVELDHLDTAGRQRQAGVEQA